jgi:hypothetical protein
MYSAGGAQIATDGGYGGSNYGNNSGASQRPAAAQQQQQPMYGNNAPLGGAYGQSSAKQPQQQQQQQQQQPQQQQQQQQNSFTSGPGFGNLQAMAPMGSMALNYGQSLVTNNMSFLLSYLVAFRYYFQVDNQYVRAKLRLLLFPFAHKDWTRKATSAAEQQQQQQQGGVAAVYVWQTPAHDVNAPDLYIPTMAFLTYVLTLGFARGAAGAFSPDVLGVTCSAGLVMLVIEVVIIKLGFYLTSPATPPPLSDLVAYAAYKYVGCCVDLLAGLLLGRWPFCT